MTQRCLLNEYISIMERNKPGEIESSMCERKDFGDLPAATFDILPTNQKLIIRTWLQYTQPLFHVVKLVYKGIQFFSYFCSKTYILGTHSNNFTKAVVTGAQYQYFLSINKQNITVFSFLWEWLFIRVSYKNKKLKNNIFRSIFLVRSNT